MTAGKTAAIVLIVTSVLGFVYGSFSDTKDTHKPELGPIELSVKDKQTVNVPKKQDHPKDRFKHAHSPRPSRGCPAIAGGLVGHVRKWRAQCQKAAAAARPPTSAVCNAL